MNRQEKLQIFTAALQGLLASGEHHCVGEEGCGDAAFKVVDAALEVVHG
jgi:hypothetical protein